jgi:hypothetical protein
MGMDTSEQDMNNIVIFTDRMISLALYRKQVHAQSYSTDHLAPRFAPPSAPEPCWSLPFSPFLRRHRHYVP